MAYGTLFLAFLYADIKASIVDMFAKLEVTTAVTPEKAEKISEGHCKATRHATRRATLKKRIAQKWLASRLALQRHI
jgi:hypothetical protein